MKLSHFSFRNFESFHFENSKFFILKPFGLKCFPHPAWTLRTTPDWFAHAQHEDVVPPPAEDAKPSTQAPAEEAKPAEPEVVASPAEEAKPSTEAPADEAKAAESNEVELKPASEMVRVGIIKIALI